MSATTYTHDHLVRDLIARILDRLASQAPTKIPPVLEALELKDMPRLAAPAGVSIQGSCPHAIGRQALETVAQHLGWPLKENPSAGAIENGDLVLITLTQQTVEANLKAAESRLGNQLKAVERTSAIAAVSLEDFDAWSNVAKAKIAAVIGRHQHPRVFMTISRASDVAPSAFVQRCVALEVGEEITPCRRRALAM